MSSSATTLDTPLASSPSTTSNVVRAIALGGLAVGVLDAIDGVGAASSRGVSRARSPTSNASQARCAGTRSGSNRPSAPLAKRR